jgi:hypothetical protein
MWWKTKRPPTVARLRLDVVHFLDLERGNVAVFGEPGGNAGNLSPPVRSVALHLELVGLDDDVRRADGPGVTVGVLLCRRHIGGVAARRAAVGPFRDRRNLVVAERRVVVKLLDADVLLDVPRRHDAGPRADAGALLDGARPGPDVLVGHERHRRNPIGPVAILAAALQDRRDVLREGRLRRHAGGRRDDG